MTQTVSSDSANDSFLEALGLMPGAAPELVEAKFMMVVRGRIQLAMERGDMAAGLAEDRTLRLLFEQYFRSCMLWVTAEMKKPRPKNIKADLPDALAQKKRARAMVETLQGRIILFAQCHMWIDNITAQIRGQIRAANAAGAGVRANGAKWTGDVGTAMARDKKHQHARLAAIARAEAMRPVLGDVDQNLTQAKQALALLHGADKAEPLMRKIASPLRKADFARAREGLAAVLDMPRKTNDAAALAAFEQNTVAAIALLEENADQLGSGDEGKIFLRPNETDVTFNTHLRELRRIRAFALKHQLPYFEYKLEAAGHLRDKMAVAGSMDSLMLLYRRLLTGFTTPMPDMAAARQYEMDVVDKTAYMTEAQLAEVPLILERAREILQECHDYNADLAASAVIDDMQERGGSSEAASAEAV